MGDAMRRKLDGKPTYICPEKERLLSEPFKYLLYFHYVSEKVSKGSNNLRFTVEECQKVASKGICTLSCNRDYVRSLQFTLMEEAGKKNGFSEFSKTVEDLSNYERNISIVRGFLVNETKTVVIMHRDLPEKHLPERISKSRNRSTNIENFYDGEEFLLALLNGKVYACSKKLIPPIKNFIKAVFAIKLDKDDFFDLYIDRLSKENYEFERVRVDAETGNFFIDVHWLTIAIAGLIGEDFEEAERVIISEKIYKSSPFFRYRAPINVNWQKFKVPQDDNFQELCRLLLNHEADISNIVSIGKTRAADRGRDFEAIETINNVENNGATKVSWLIQCKFSGKSISTETIKGWTDRVREHGYDGYWLMTNNDITPDLFDQLRSVERNTGIKTKIWQRADFHIKLNIHSEYLLNGAFFEEE